MNTEKFYYSIFQEADMSEKEDRRYYHGRSGQYRTGDYCKKAFADKSLYDLCNPVVVGDACVMEAALPIVGHTEMKIHAIKDVSGSKI